MKCTSPDRKRQRRRLARGGFTLIECLATMLLMAIVLPVVDQGIATVTSSASVTKRRTEAAGLAESKLSELISTGNWQGGASMKGDFGSDWPDYTWQANLLNWTDGSQNITMQQLDVVVNWTARNQPQSITVSGLVYARTTTSD